MQSIEKSTFGRALRPLTLLQCVCHFTSILLPFSTCALQPRNPYRTQVSFANFTNDLSLSTSTSTSTSLTLDSSPVQAVKMSTLVHSMMNQLSDR